MTLYPGKHPTKKAPKTILLTALLFCAAAFQIKTTSFVQIPGDTLKIAILGDSRSKGEGGSDGLNKEVLSKLLSMVRAMKPDAVFFTGDLTLGLEKEDEIEDSSGANVPGPEEDIFGTHWQKEGFVYNKKEFEKSLNVFSEILNSNLGSDIPFHPLIGNHEAVGPDAISIFKQHFKIRNTAPIDSMHLVYTVEIKNCLFVILATDYYSRDKEKLIEHELSGAQVGWLEKELEDSRNNFKFKFVMGHEPSFSLRGIEEGKPVGLDKYPEARDTFWNILKKYEVNAYLCAHEHLYNSSKYDGMWQIISGGAGAPLEKENKGAFYHYLILKIPPGEESVPRITVIDIDGNIRDQFELK